MKKTAPVECVSLSDSLPSPRPNCKAAQAMAAYKAGHLKVVCLDSDTESDGSYTQLGFVRSVPKESATVSTAGKSCTDDYEEEDHSWLSANVSAAGKSCIDRNGDKDGGWFTLRKCSAKRKSWSTNISITPEKVDEQQEFLDHCIRGAEVTTLPSPKRQDDCGSRKEESDKRLVFQKCSSGRKIWSPSLLLGSECDQDKSQLVGADDYFVSMFCKENNEPREYHKTLVEDQYPESGSLYGTLPSASAHFKDKKKPQVEEKSPDHGKQINSIHLDIDSSPASLCSEHLSELHKPKKELDAFRIDSACSGFISSEPDDDSSSIPRWDDNLNSLLRNIKTTKCVKALVGLGKTQGHESNTAIAFSDEERGCEGFSFHKKDFSKLDSAYASVEASDDTDNLACKRPKKGGEGRPRKNNIMGGKNDTESTREAERQRKVEARTSKQQEKEIKKKQLQEEKDKLRQEKEEEKKRLQEARRKRSEEDKRRKEELRAEAAEQRKVEREKEKWGKGKFALQSITAFVDTEILEGGLIGGHLLTRFAEKGFKYHLVKNPVRKTVLWQMNRPSEAITNDRQVDTMLDESDDAKSPAKQDKLSKSILVPKLSLKSADVSYVLVVLEAEEFLDMIVQGVLDGHIKTVQKRYRGFTVCYLINKLMRYLHKREQQQYKNPEDNWVRPPVEQVLAQFVTSYDGVHSRLCLDEAEVAEHIVGLTRGLAECPFKRKLTPLSLSANGDHVVKNDPNSELIKKNVWLKALVAIPKVSGSCAIAIAKKYPSMSSLFNAYLDPSKTVYEKEHLLEDLMKEGLLGGENSRRVGPACSRRIYRIMMAQQGSLFTDDVEDGADYFKD